MAGTAAGLRAALRCEILKARRSRLPLVVAAGFSLAPLMAGLFMVIIGDPDQARRWGLITAKARLFTETADWTTFLGVLAQAVAIGGMILFAVVTAWIFGREFVDRTAKTLLAVPTPRSATVLAKFVVAAGLCALLTMWVLALGTGIGAALGLPGGSGRLFAEGAVRVAVVGGLTIALITPVAFFAGVGRGYLAPLGFALLTVFLAQIVAATGWGAWFPWSVAPLLAGVAGPEAAGLPAGSHVGVIGVAAAGLAATLAWWRRADQTE